MQKIISILPTTFYKNKTVIGLSYLFMHLLFYFNRQIYEDLIYTRIRYLCNIKY